MPKRNDINKILVIGAGPIIVGQGCEFDYSGVQACKALKTEGYYVILANSNPATIMTDVDTANSTYIEPLRLEELIKIIEREKPDALLPTMGGQTALNCTLELAKYGILEKYNIEVIGASISAIEKSENRSLFKKLVKNIGLEVPVSFVVNNINTTMKLQNQLTFPVVVRPSFTLGGSGGGIAYNKNEFLENCQKGIELSPSGSILIEEFLLGWKEFEMEIIRDRNDNCIVVCTIENLDPMGIHTGDSITVAPAQTLTDKEYHNMRRAAFAIIREVGLETGGANVQFAINPNTGKMLIIEINPRVSRSSALASKATGFPIAKVAAKLAVGYSLDELKNDIASGITSSFEPTIDYVVTKIPRFNFEKFPSVVDYLTTQMKSVGEVMSIGRTFKESLQKALCSLEIGKNALNNEIKKYDFKSRKEIIERLSIASSKRIFYIADAFRFGFTLEEVQKLTKIDPWFLTQINELVIIEEHLKKIDPKNLDALYLLNLKKKGFSDKRIAELINTNESYIRNLRYVNNIHPVYKRVDSCAAEFSTTTAYLYSAYEQFCESLLTKNKKIIILGSGPTRIGQGIEFDYSCVHAANALKKRGYETIMVNCNPETVSTDYDVSDRLYFEPLSLEYVLEIIRIENPVGILVQYGGQTPLKLAKPLSDLGFPILGDISKVIDTSENREKFQKFINSIGLKQPDSIAICDIHENHLVAKKLGFPLIIRPSYVLGGQFMKVVNNFTELGESLHQAVAVSNGNPVLIEKFLENAIEVDVDAICDGEEVLIGGILQHIEPAGIHSGDSICTFPPYNLLESIQNEICIQVIKIAKEIGVIGPLNVQIAIQNNKIYILEVNPRVSRTVPFLIKATGIPLVDIGIGCLLGARLNQLNIPLKANSNLLFIKCPIFSFDKFPGVSIELGPEMKSTGEIMGIGRTLEECKIKSLRASSLKNLESGALLPVYRLQDIHKTTIAKSLEV